MGLELDCTEGQTPLNEEEKDGLLISSITTREELDEFEQQNIEKAIEWTLGKKFKKEKIITEGFVCELHYRMFNTVWKWAGEFRHNNKNLGCDWKQISILVKQLNDDCIFWMKNTIYNDEEIAIRYKHRIVCIHCFSNGNGRHSRLMADIIINHIFGKPVFSWGSSTLNKKGESRSNYLKAVREADKGCIGLLLEFARKK